MPTSDLQLTTHRVGYNHLRSTNREWSDCFIQNNRVILLDLGDFALKEQGENLMLAISWAWCNSPYTMTTKPNISLELQYATIQFLIIGIILSLFSGGVLEWFYMKFAQ